MTTTTADAVLAVDGLTKQYGRAKVLNGLSMQVQKGAIYGLIGRNGAGKTTLMRIICGLQSPSAGSYRLYGTPWTDPHIGQARRRMGAIVETPSMYRDMTAVQNLKDQFRVLGRPSFDGIDPLLRLVGLEDTGNKKAKHFSLGMRQRLGIAIALAGDPDFLVLDEPINGLDPQGIVEIRELILQLNRKHRITVLISSHILDELSRLATHYGFIDGGRVVREVGAAELEKALRRRTRLTVSDTPALARALDTLGLSYAIVSKTEADLYGQWDVTAVVTALTGEGCVVHSMTAHDESLESYYINLMGGDDHA